MRYSRLCIAAPCLSLLLSLPLSYTHTHTHTHSSILPPFRIPPPASTFGPLFADCEISASRRVKVANFIITTFPGRNDKGALFVTLSRCARFGRVDVAPPRCSPFPRFRRLEEERPTLRDRPRQPRRSIRHQNANYRPIRLSPTAAK